MQSCVCVLSCAGTLLSAFCAWAHLTLRTVLPGRSDYCPHLPRQEPRHKQPSSLPEATGRWPGEASLRRSPPLSAHMKHWRETQECGISTVLSVTLKGALPRVSGRTPPRGAFDCLRTSTWNTDPDLTWPSPAPLGSAFAGPRVETGSICVMGSAFPAFCARAGASGRPLVCPAPGTGALRRVDPSGASAECMSERGSPRACCRQPGLAVLSLMEWEGGQAGGSKPAGTCELGCSGTLRTRARKQGRGRAA